MKIVSKKVVEDICSEKEGVKQRFGVLLEIGVAFQNKKNILKLIVVYLLHFMFGKICDT